MLIDDELARHPQAWPSKLERASRPSSGDNQLEEYLARVDRLIDDRVRDLPGNATPAADTWMRLAPTVAPRSATDERPTLGSLVDLPELLATLIHSGGKRIRPLMAYLGFWASGRTEPDEDVVRIGAALELLHSFALVHDDVMDESPSRRGHPTTHTRAAADHRALDAAGGSKRFGESIAILLGDLAHAEADDLIADCPTPVRAKWRALVGELIRGQLGDLTGAADRARDPELALSVAGLKSGGYTIQRPLELGAIAANADEAVRRSLSAYGREIGWAFALRDDILGVWGDPKVTGKPAGDDLVSGKPTVIIALADQRLAPAEHSLLSRIGTTDLLPADVKELQQAIRTAGIEADVEAMITHHVERGIGYLADLPAARLVRPSSDPTSGTEPISHLVRIARQVAWRDR
ncbi:MAG TPA: polyprenyl synthetase family protein [Microlunatus sp.]